MEPSFEPVVPFFRDSLNFVLTTHTNPDGDGLGCEVALAEWLTARGKVVSIINHSATPSMYDFLDEHGRILKFDAARDAKTVSGADVIIVLDTNQPYRLRSMEQPVLESTAVKICIDHHLDPGPFAQHYLLDDDATSTGEIVYHLLLYLSKKLTAEGAGTHRLSPRVAQGLFCAIMTDTGSFRYPRVDPDTFRISAHLIECGADPVQIYAMVYERWSPGRIQLLGETLASLKMMYEGKLACVTITQDILRKTGTSEVDTDNFTTYPMSIDGVVVGMLFLELKHGTKISFRSKGNIPINELAKEFGGNGHKNAAGATLDEADVHEIRDRVIKAAAKYFTD